MVEEGGVFRFRAEVAVVGVEEGVEAEDGGEVKLGPGEDAEGGPAGFREGEVKVKEDISEFSPQRRRERGARSVPGRPGLGGPVPGFRRGGRTGAGPEGGSAHGKLHPESGVPFAGRGRSEGSV